jgi:Ca2+-transporting ATPase
MSYIIAIHVPIAGMSIIPVLFNLPLVFSPIIIAFLEIIIDPACSLLFEAEPEEDDIMRRPPRQPDQRIFNKRNVIISLLQGLSVLLFVAAVFSFGHIRGMDEMEIRALTFTTLVFANLGLILTNRSWEHTIWMTRRQPNPALWWIVGGTLALLGFVLYAPFMRDLFQFAYLTPLDIGICFATGVLSVVWFEVLKYFTHRKKPPH